MSMEMGTQVMVMQELERRAPDLMRKGVSVIDIVEDGLEEVIEKVTGVADTADWRPYTFSQHVWHMCLCLLLAHHDHGCKIISLQKLPYPFVFPHVHTRREQNNWIC